MWNYSTFQAAYCKDFLEFLSPDLMFYPCQFWKALHSRIVVHKDGEQRPSTGCITIGSSSVFASKRFLGHPRPGVIFGTTLDQVFLGPPKTVFLGSPKTGDVFWKLQLEPKRHPYPTQDIAIPCWICWHADMNVQFVELLASFLNLCATNSAHFTSLKLHVFKFIILGKYQVLVILSNEDIKWY